MKSRFTVLSLVVCTTVIFCPLTSWALTYDEGVDGDLSGIAAAPTGWGTLDVGSNTLTATSGGGDFDHVGFTIAAGAQLDSIVLTAYSGSSVSFTGLQSGNAWTAGIGGAVNPALILGWSHFGAPIGGDILSTMSTSPGAIGFSTPLVSGNYNMLLQETGSTPVTYTLAYNVSLVPEPATLGMLALAGVACLATTRGRRLR